MTTKIEKKLRQKKADKKYKNSKKGVLKIKQYLKENREKLRKYKENYRRGLAGRATYLLTVTKKRALKLFHRAKFRNKDNFEITREWVLKKLKKGKCEITGIYFSYDKPKSHYNANPFSPSLDRLDCKKGYTFENTRVVIWSYNAAKSYLDKKDFKKLIKGINRGIKQCKF